MKPFALIQRFFTQMQCPQCGNHLREEGIALLKQERTHFLVSIDCQLCHSHVGVAMVGMEQAQRSGSRTGQASASSLQELLELLEAEDTDELSALDDDGDDDTDADDDTTEDEDAVSPLSKRPLGWRRAAANGLAHSAKGAYEYDTDTEDDDDEDADEEALPFGGGGSKHKALPTPHFAGALGLGPLRRRYKDPELTDLEKARLAEYKPISDEDVLEAHHFFKGLGRNWQQLIPPEMLERCTGSDTLSP
jgi:hypothetical protein